MTECAHFWAIGQGEGWRQRYDRDRGIKRVALAWVNAVLRPLDLQLSSVRAAPNVWDRQFVKWIRDAEATGRDPNDIGDERWREDLLDTALEEHYLPAVGRDSVVLELGPGSGRLSRHLIGRCRELILVDTSQIVCDWLSRYLDGKGQFRIFRIDGPRFMMVHDEEIDAVLGMGSSSTWIWTSCTGSLPSSIECCAPVGR